MNVEPDAVVNKLAEQVSRLSVENAMLSAAVDALQAELEELKKDENA